MMGSSYLYLYIHIHTSKCQTFGAHVCRCWRRSRRRFTWSCYNGSVQVKFSAKSEQATHRALWFDATFFGEEVLTCCVVTVDTGKGSKFSSAYCGNLGNLGNSHDRLCPRSTHAAGPPCRIDVSGYWKVSAPYFVKFLLHAPSCSGCIAALSSEATPLGSTLCFTGTYIDRNVITGQVSKLHHASSELEAQSHVICRMPVYR